MSGRHAAARTDVTAFSQADLDGRFAEAAKWVRAFRLYVERFDRAGADRDRMLERAMRVAVNLEGLLADVDVIADCVAADEGGLGGDVVDKIRVLRGFVDSMRRRLGEMRAVAGLRDRIAGELDSLERFANGD